MYYFAYGSNMSIKRLRSRARSASKVGIGFLEMHLLKFHKVGRIDGSAKCDACETGVPGHRVHGVVFDIAGRDKPVLAREEGVGCGYAEKVVSIMLNDGTTIEAFTYYATIIDPALRPFDWYAEHVIIGARESELPEDYIQYIESIECDKDPDDERRERELSIYR